MTCVDYEFNKMMRSMYTELDQHIDDGNNHEATRVFTMICELRLIVPEGYRCV